MNKLQQEYIKFQEELIKLKEKLDQDRDIKEEAVVEALEELFGSVDWDEIIKELEIKEEEDNEQ